MTTKEKHLYKKYDTYSTKAYALDIAAALRKRGHRAKVLPYKSHPLFSTYIQRRSKWVVMWIKKT